MELCSGGVQQHHCMAKCALLYFISMLSFLPSFSLYHFSPLSDAPSFPCLFLLSSLPPLIAFLPSLLICQLWFFPHITTQLHNILLFFILPLFLLLDCIITATHALHIRNPTSKSSQWGWIQNFLTEGRAPSHLTENSRLNSAWDNPTLTHIWDSH